MAMNDHGAFDPRVHAVTYRPDPRPWGLGWRPECTCGWRGMWYDRRTDAEVAGAVHQAQPDGEADW